MKKQLKITGVLAFVLITAAVLTACLPSGLSEGHNGDPRSMSKYTDYDASIYVQNGLALPYRLYAPANPAEGASYPLLVFLHGKGENGVDNQKQIYPLFYKKMAEYRASLGESYVMIPQAAQDKNWEFYLEGDAGNVLSAAVDDLVSRFGNIDVERLYLSGLSLGGYGTVTALRLQPEKYAAAFSICGGDSFFQGGSDYVPAEAVLTSLAKTPILFAHGENDAIVSPEFSRKLSAGVARHGGETRLEIFPSYEHNIWNRCFETKEYWEWLFSHRRAG